MAMEGSRRREFTQFVTYHVLGAIDWNELVPVMHREGQSNHVRYDHRTARPRADNPLVTGRHRRINFLLQMAVDKRTLLQRAQRCSFNPVFRAPGGSRDIDPTAFWRASCNPW